MILLDDFFWEAAVNGANILGERTAWLRFDLLDFLEPAAGDEQSSSLGVMWQHLAELADHVFQHVRRSVMKQWLQSR